LRRARTLAAALALVATSACMTLDTQTNASYEGPQIYSGTRKDLEIFGPAFLSLNIGWMMFTLVDLPFSLVADTLLLPVTIPRDRASSATRAEELQVEHDRPALVTRQSGEAPVDVARRLFDACRERLRRQDAALTDCYAIDARITLTGGSSLTGAQYKGVIRAALDRNQATGVFVDWRDPSYAADGERVRIHATRRSSSEPVESPLELVVAAGSDGGWRIVEEASVGYPER